MGQRFSFSAHEEQSDPPAQPAALDGWILSTVGRAVVVAMLHQEGAESASFAHLAEALARYAAFRVGVERLSPGADLRASVRKIVSLAPDIVLLCDELHLNYQPDNAWSVRALRMADEEGMHLLTFVALVGTGIERNAARRMGFEYGFDLGQDPSCIARVLAREAAAREAARRYGSSPPCYL